MTAESDQPSKSARKREAIRLQALGRRLTELKDEQLAEIALDDKLTHAIDEYRRFTSREARRRQLQFIGRLMRDVDVAPLQAVLDRIDGSSAQARRAHKTAEVWRTRLVTEPDALTAFIAAYPATNRQALRRLLKRIRDQRDETQLKSLHRELFRFVRDQSEREQSDAQDDAL